MPCLQASLLAPGALQGLRPSSWVHTLSAPPCVHIVGFHCRFDHPQQCVCTMKMRVSVVVWGDCTVRNTRYVPAKCSVSQQTGSRSGRKMKRARASESRAQCEAEGGLPASLALLSSRFNAGFLQASLRTTKSRSPGGQQDFQEIGTSASTASASGRPSGLQGRRTRLL